MGRGRFKMNLLWILVSILPTALSQTGCVRNRNFFQHEPADTELKEGETGSLYCIFRANQVRDLVSCFWYKDGLPVGVQGSYAFFGKPNEGDCSMKITNSTVIRDDGQWTCARTLQGTNCIQSRTANYRVLSPPRMPSVRMTYDSGRLTNGSYLGLFSSPMTPPPTIECRSEGGNPPAKLRFSTSLPTEIHFSTYNFTMGVKGINLTAISVARLPQLDETWYGQNLFCVAEHQLEYHTVYITIVKPGESPCSSSKISTSYIIIGALLLILLGGGFGAVLLHFYQKRKAEKNAAGRGEGSDPERITNELTNVNENEDSSSKLETVEYSSLAYPKPTKTAPSQPSTQNELCYAELDIKVLNNARRH